MWIDLGWRRGVGYNVAANLPPEVSGLVFGSGGDFFLADQGGAVVSVSHINQRKGAVSERGAAVTMQKIKQEFKAASPSRRMDGKFYSPKFKPRRPKSVNPVFGYTKPHGQES